MRFLLLIIYLILPINFALSENLNKTYFAGGCFWCMEESFEKLNGVKEVISGYSGGTTSNPTYKEVTYGNTGHFEVVEVIYDKDVISFKELLKNFWINIDPFDAFGQFCDKGYSYRSVAFYQNQYEKKTIEESIVNIEDKFNKRVVTYVREFKVFYKAEDKHQDYYQEYLLNYLMYKKGCGREEVLKRIWKL
ncbi:peptide-methionine (S)-S-oxide reductase MsrA [Candidatus Pelagibacter sp.]|nr:peptide-methionine (S)-S-oxide reductase MsrA [Candidatus Pelagibacter sp.]